MGRIIGIDLGTTNSVGAYWKRRRARIIENHYSSHTPSVVWVRDGSETVGRDAKDRLAGISENVIYSVKRFVGVDFEDTSAQKATQNFGYEARQSDDGGFEFLLDNGYYTPVQVSAIILKQIKKDAEIKLGEEVTHAVITVPAYFGQRQKNATREAGKLAGLIVPRIITEPTAAALAFGVEEKIDEPQDILVYDLGGGTFDVSILSIIDNNFDVLNIDGDRFLGGDNFDDLLTDKIIDHIKSQHRVDFSNNKIALRQLKSLAEKAKIDLSRQEETRVIAEMEQDGRPLPIEMTITRSEFENFIEPLVDRTTEIVETALEQAGLTADDLDRVLLVGGSTRIPLVRRRMKALFGDKIEIDVDPMHCVALGAAVQTAALPENELQGEIAEQDIVPGEAPVTPVTIDKADNLPEITMQDMTPTFIGVETDGGEIVSVIPKGTLYPTFDPYKQVFKTNRSGQQIYELPIYESETEDAAREKWERIGVVKNEKLPPGLPKASDVMVEMSIDHDGILSVVSYLKNDPMMHDKTKGTLEERSFNFGQSQASEQGTVLADLEFVMSLFESTAQSPRLNKYLTPQQTTQVESHIGQAKSVLDTGDEDQAQIQLNHMNELRRELPAQIETLIFAEIISSNKQVVTSSERSDVRNLMNMLEQDIERGDMDRANDKHQQLQAKISEMIDKYPSNLLTHR